MHNISEEEGIKSNKYIVFDKFQAYFKERYKHLFLLGVHPLPLTYGITDILYAHEYALASFGNQVYKRASTVSQTVQVWIDFRNLISHPLELFLSLK